MDARARNPSPFSTRFLLALVACGVSSGLLHAGGNVSVRVDRAGNLIVEGDAAGNQILISPIGIGVGTVLGLEGTRVNGAESANFSGVVADFRIRMRGGDDRVLVSDGDGNTVPDDLKISTGDGNDFVLVQGFFVRDDLMIHTGAGNDSIEIADTVIVSDLTSIGTGSGDDRLLFRPADVADFLIVFENDFRVQTGSGRDFVGISGAL